MALPSVFAPHISVIKKGAAVIHENVVKVSKNEYIYRLTVLPRDFFRGEKKQFYSVSVSSLKDKGRSALLRDFTADRATADRFYHLLCLGGVCPEHLEEIYDDFMST